MKLKSVLTGSAAAATLMAASVANASGYYVSVFGGISTMDDEFNVHSTTQFRKGLASTFNWTGTGTASFYGGPVLGTDTHAITFGFKATYQSRTYYGSNDWVDGFENGYVVGASLGWDFGTGWRSEFEVAMRVNDIDGGAQENGYFHVNHFTFNYTGTQFYACFPGSCNAFSQTTDTNTFTVTTIAGSHTHKTYVTTYNPAATSIVTQTVTGTTTAVTTVRHTAFNTAIETQGDVTTWSYMANLWYDFDLGDSRIHPFIGGGIGLAQVDLEYTAHAYTMDGSAYTYSGGDDDWGFAYQLGAGLGFEFDNGMMLTAQYRYFATGEVQAGLRDQPSFNVESQNFLIGLTFPIGGGM